MQSVPTSLCSAPPPWKVTHSHTLFPRTFLFLPTSPTMVCSPEPRPPVSSICLVLTDSLCSIFIERTSYLFVCLQFCRPFGVRCGVSEPPASRLGRPPSVESGSWFMCSLLQDPVWSVCGAGHFHAGNALFSLWLKFPCPLRNLALGASFLLPCSLNPML